MDTGIAAIERLEVASDPGRVRACYRMYADGAGADDPRVPPMSARVFAGWLAHGWTDGHPQTWLALDRAGRPRGWYSLALPDRDNPHAAFLHVVVDPPGRRRGLGGALVADAAARAASAGRRLLAGSTIEGTPGESFARALGARRGLPEARRVLDLAAVPDGHLASLRGQAAAAARGYSLRSWQGAVPAPEAGPVARLYRAMADAPHGDGWQPEHWDEARVRAVADRAAAQGLRHYTVTARHDESGDLAGLTQLAVDPARPDWGYQELTVVARPHRGHRLGLLVKAAMLELLAVREPGLRTIVTGNAATNEHMIAINEALGYRLLDLELDWELAVTDALAAAPGAVPGRQAPLPGAAAGRPDGAHGQS